MSYQRGYSLKLTGDVIIAYDETENVRNLDTGGISHGHRGLSRAPQSAFMAGGD